MNGIRVSGRSPPRRSWAGVPLYRIDMTVGVGRSGDGKLFSIHDLERSRRIVSEQGEAECVVYDYRYYRVHSAKELPSLLKQLQADAYDGSIAYYKHRPFNLRADQLRDFIVTWEKPVAYKSPM